MPGTVMHKCDSDSGQHTTVMFMELFSWKLQSLGSR